jgi:hypothetical protein
LRRVPHAAEVYFWTAACWGQWALGRGKLAAAREGVAGKLRDLAQTVIDLDAGLEEGGGDRVLGRLHHQAPRIPFLTGWVSKEKALVHLRRSYAIAPNNSATRFFLADAILDLEPRSREEALRLLRACRDDPPRPEYLDRRPLLCGRGAQAVGDDPVEVRLDGHTGARGAGSRLARGMRSAAARNDPPSRGHSWHRRA